jgi:hypothetical protein
MLSQLVNLGCMFESVVAAQRRRGQKVGDRLDTSAPVLDTD